MKGGCLLLFFREMEGSHNCISLSNLHCLHKNSKDFRDVISSYAKWCIFYWWFHVALILEHDSLSEAIWEASFLLMESSTQKSITRENEGQPLNVNLQKAYCLFQVFHLLSLLSINFKKWMNNWCCDRRVSRSGLRVSIGRANLPSMQGGKFPLKSTNYHSDMQLITYSNIHRFQFHFKPIKTKQRF